MQAVVAELEKHGALPGSQSDALVNLKVAGKFVKSKLRTELGLPRDHLEAWGTIDAEKVQVRVHAGGRGKPDWDSFGPLFRPLGCLSYS